MAQPKFFLQPLTAAICVASYSVSALASDAHNTPDTPLQLAPIVVTAQLANDANGLIIHADPKQAVQPIPAVDGAAYLQNIPGFNQVKSGGANSDVTFRGMFGSRIKIITDGTENLGACPSRMDSPTSYISPESYDRITVVKGPQTVQYAHTGSAATVSFEREPEKLTADKPYRGQASVLMGSYGRLDHNIETAIGDETKYVRLNSSRSVSDDYKDGDGTSIHSNWKKWNADLAFGWTPDDDTWVELKGGKADAEMAYAGRKMDGSQFRRDSLGLHLQKKNLSEVIKQVDVQVDYSNNNHIMDNFSLRTPPHMRMETRVTRRTLNASANMLAEWDKLSLKTGIDSQHNKHAKNLVSDMKFESYGAFAELSYPLNDTNKIVTGARLDQVDISNFNTQATRKETLPSGFVRLENEIAEHGLKNYVGVGYVERVPDYWELFSTDFYGTTIKPFNLLKNEKTTQLDFGTQFEHGAFSAWASGYAGVINDFILMTYVPNEKGELITKSRNVDATIAGVEAGVGYQFTDQIQADVSTMYAWGENTTDNTALPQIAPLEARVNLRYVEDKYNVGLLWRTVASQNRISLNEGNIVGYDIGKSKSFNVLSINATYNLTSGVDLSVGIDNLLDTTYTEHLNKLGNAGFGFASDEQFNNIGRNYWARMSMKF